LNVALVEAAPRHDARADDEEANDHRDGAVEPLDEVVERQAEREQLSVAVRPLQTAGRAGPGDGGELTQQDEDERERGRHGREIVRAASHIQNFRLSVRMRVVSRATPEFDVRRIRLRRVGTGFCR